MNREVLTSLESRLRQTTLVIVHRKSSKSSFKVALYALRSESMSKPEMGDDENCQNNN